VDSFLTTFGNDLLNGLVETFTSPRKRLFLGYVAMALLIGLVWLRWQGRSFKSALAALLSRDIWLSASARADYAIVLINRALFLLLSPLLLGQLAVATWLYFQLFDHYGLPPAAGSLLPDWAVVTCFTLWFFLLDDFARYYLHRLLHRWPVLWAFHKMHHSARVLTPLTVLRTHPVEGLLFSLRSVLVQGLSIGLFKFFFASQVDLYTVLGVNVIVFTFNVAGSNLRHSHVPIHYWPWLEKILISPAQHQIHHSTEVRHFDTNFGAVLAIWDGFGGSLHRSEPGVTLSFGLSKRQASAEQQLSVLYLQPFKEAMRCIGRWLSGARRGSWLRNR